VNGDTTGFLEVVESSSMSFDEFRTRILQNNAGMPDTLAVGGDYTFVGADGHRYGFKWRGHSRRPNTSR
jgi:hypothetical protein